MEGTTDAAMPLKHGECTVSTEDANCATTKNPLQHLLIRYWGWEILAYATSFIALVALIVVLQTYNGKGIPDWPFGITINSVLSWITQILNACMLAVLGACISQSKWIHFNECDRPLIDVNTYDSASRGPLGSFIFLTKRRLGLRNFATVGAVVTILSIGVGPLVQQMAVINDVRVNSDIPANVSRAGAFLDTYYMNTVPSSGLISSIYRSLSGVSSSSTNSNSVMPDCPTGNCDFSPFQSLAVCSKCTNITDLLSVSVANYPCIGSYPLVNHTLPNGIHTQVGGGFSDRTINPAIAGEADKEVLSASEELGPSSFVNFTAIFIANDSKLDHASAIQCSLLWCVNTYAVHMENNIVHETLLDSYHDPKSWFDDELLELQPHTKENLTTSTFAVSATTSGLLSGWFADKLSMNNSIDAGDTVFCEGESITTDRQQVVTEFTQPFQESSIPAIFDQIAAGMTSFIRKQGQTRLEYKDMITLTAFFGDPAQGTSWMIQTQIRVRWAWITFPATLLALTSFFFVTTALKSNTRKLGVWKSSSIPLLCSGLDQDVQRSLLENASPVMAEKLAKDVQVRLLDRDATECPE